MSLYCVSYGGIHEEFREREPEKGDISGNF